MFTSMVALLAIRIIDEEFAVKFAPVWNMETEPKITLRIVTPIAKLLASQSLEESQA